MLIITYKNLYNGFIHYYKNVFAHKKFIAYNSKFPMQQALQLPFSNARAQLNSTWFDALMKMASNYQIFVVVESMGFHRALFYCIVILKFRLLMKGGSITDDFLLAVERTVQYLPTQNGGFSFISVLG